MTVISSIKKYVAAADRFIEYVSDGSVKVMARLSDADLILQAARDYRLAREELLKMARAETIPAPPVLHPQRAAGVRHELAFLARNAREAAQRHLDASPGDIAAAERAGILRDAAALIESVRP